MVAAKMRSSKLSTKASDEVPDPDERCQICSETRENHGDKHHKFSVDGQLAMLEPPPKPRATPPKEIGRDETAIAFATLLEVLAEKEIIGAKDIIRILTGQG